MHPVAADTLPTVAMARAVVARAVALPTSVLCDGWLPRSTRIIRPRWRPGEVREADPAVVTAPSRTEVQEEAREAMVPRAAVRRAAVPLAATITSIMEAREVVPAVAIPVSGMEAVEA